MAKVDVTFVPSEGLEEIIQIAKDNGKRILALSPAKIVRGKVIDYVLVTQ